MTVERYPDQIALIHGARRQSWAETYARCRKLASALEKVGLPAMMKCPKERAPAYAIAGAVCGFVLFAIVATVIATLTGFGPDLFA